MSLRFKILLIALLPLLFWTGRPVSAYVNTSWDWHLVSGQPKRTINYCAGVAVRYTEQNRTVDVEALRQGLPPSWAVWLTEAVEALNKANTGWKLVPSRLSFPPCQILIVLADISENTHGGGVSTPVDTNGDGKADLVRIVIDQTLENTLENLPEGGDQLDGNRDGWGTQGGEMTRDPIGVAMHELTHAMRLAHHPDSKHSDTSDSDISDPRNPGDHDTNLSDEDIRELREAAGTQEKLGSFEIPQEGRNIEFANMDGAVEFEIPEGAFEFYPGFLDLNILYGVAIPDPLAILDAVDTDRFEFMMASGTIYFRTSQPLQKSVKVKIPYTDEELLGGDGMYVGDLHNYIPPAIDEGSLRAFRYVMEPFGVEQEGTSHWELVENSSLDTNKNKVTFETNQTGIYGIAGKAKAAAPKTEAGFKQKELISLGVVVAILFGLFFFLKRTKPHLP